MDEATLRAAGILRAQRYVAIGTADADGPWTAPAQYRLIRGAAMYVESHATSRHARAIAATGRASGAIYDAGADPADADGVQFAATATLLPRAEDILDAVLGRRLSPGADTGADLLARPDMHLLVLELTELWVFDRAAWRTRGRDDRIAVDAAEVYALLEG